MPGNAFLALRPDDATCDRLTAIIDRLRQWGLPARWTHPEDLHLTLLFLGELAEDERSCIPAAVDEVARAARVVDLRLGGLGASGGRTQPRAVFAAVTDPDGQCAALQRDLAECLEEPADERFLPHLTLARPQRIDARTAARLPPGRDWPQLLEAHGLADWGPCGWTSLALCVSEPDRVPRYRVVTDWALP
jgi:2'-5' RNA ligase